MRKGQQQQFVNYSIWTVVYLLVDYHICRGILIIPFQMLLNTLLLVSFDGSLDFFYKEHVVLDKKFKFLDHEVCEIKFG